LESPENKNASKDAGGRGKNPILPERDDSTYYEFVKQNIGGRLGKHL
jgi:hypothetical protein